MIQFEFGGPNIVTRVFFKDFYDLLSPKFQLYRLLPSSLLKIDQYDAELQEIFHHQNYLAIHKTLSK